MSYGAIAADADRLRRRPGRGARRGVRPARRALAIQLALTLVALAAALAALVLVSRNHQGSTVDAAVVIDGPALFLQGTVLVLSILGVLTMAERFDGVGPDAFTPQGAATPGSPQEALALRVGATTTEVFPLTLFAVGGMMLFPAASDLLIMFVALEVLSLPLYILSGLARRRRLLSQEAAMKYFLLGAFSSAFFLFGSALLYGYAGSMSFSAIATAITQQSGMDGAAAPGVALVSVGLLFKVGAVPFHMWTPDVYQGAPTPVTGFMAACTKVAAFGAHPAAALRRRRRQPLGLAAGAVGRGDPHHGGRLGARHHPDRHQAPAGLLLDRPRRVHPRRCRSAFDRDGVSSVLFYLAAYGFTHRRVRRGHPRPRRRVARRRTCRSGPAWAGATPLVAGVIAFLLLAFAGIPLTSGFTAQVRGVRGRGRARRCLAGGGRCPRQRDRRVRLRPGDRADVLLPAGRGDHDVVAPSVVTTLALTLGTVATLVLGILPSPLLDLATSSSLFLR